MPRLYLVRHGEAAAAWTEDPDPGLSVRGRSQARAMADALIERLRPMPVLTSPLRRTRETADALGPRWGFAPDVVSAVGEVPSPVGVPLDGRGRWLAELMEGAWSDADGGLRHWRDEVVNALTALPHDAVVVTHFVAINVAVGAAEGVDRVVAFHPGYCSVTVVEHDGETLRLLEQGVQADTLVL